MPGNTVIKKCTVLPMLFDQFELIRESGNGVTELRELILNLAVRGQLVSLRDEDKDLVCRKSTVNDFVTMQNGYAFKSTWFVNGGIRLVRNANIGHGRLDWSDMKRISKKQAEEFERFRLTEGDIVLSLDRPLITTGLKLARITAADLPSLLLQRVARPVFEDDRLAPDFFYMWLGSPAFTGSIDPGKSNGVPHISTREVHKLALAPPTIQTQKRIVEKVDTLMGMCDQLQASLDRERELRAASSHSCLIALTSSHEPTEGSSETSPSKKSNGKAKPKNQRSADWRLSTAWERLCNHFEVLFDVPETLSDLRQSILQIAVQGKLVRQDPSDELAGDVLNELAEWKARVLGSHGKKTPKDAKPIDSNEIPFSLPISWAWTRIDNVLSLKHGYAFKSSTFTHDQTPFVLTTPGNFHETGGFRDRGPKTRFVNADVEPEFTFEAGDLMIPMTEQAPGLLGSPGFIPNDGRTYVHNQRLGKLEVYSPVISPDFVFLFFNSPYLRNELAKTCSGTTVRHTSPKKVLNVLFPVCAPAEQKRIVAKVSSLQSHLDKLERQHANRQATAQQLLTATIHQLLNEESGE